MELTITGTNVDRISPSARAGMRLRAALALAGPVAVRARSLWREGVRRLRDRMLGWDLGPVTIVVVSYNGLALIRQCLDSIFADPSYPRYRVVVVDNASDEPVRAYLRQVAATRRRVRVIFNDTNVGFAAANNIGLRHLDDGEYIVLLNNDTVVPPGWLGQLLRHARDPEVGLVGPVTNAAWNEARIDVPYTAVADMPAFARAYTGAHRGKRFAIKMLAMYCVAMRRDVFERIGFLDERFGQGLFEDDDYSRRVKEAGYQVVCAEDAFVHHHGMGSFSKLSSAAYRALFARNQALYEDKWREPWVPHQQRASAAADAPGGAW